MTSRLRGAVCVVLKAELLFSPRFPNPLMRFFRSIKSGAGLRRVLVFILLALVAASAQVPSPWVDTKPLAVDTGVVGLKLILRRLHTTAPLMPPTPHPAD